MSTELVAFESQLKPLAPMFAEVLGKTMPVERMMRTVMVSTERNPRLLKCDRQSLLNAAMTFAVLGLEVDGVTGQGFLVPFKDKKKGIEVVQPIIGYLGYNTLGARAGMTISGRVVREGDGFEYDESLGVIHHHRKLGGEVGANKRKIVAVWALARAMDRPPVARVLSADEVLAVKVKSPRGNEPPWADPEIGYPAMAEKTAKRRLRRDMPLNVYQLAARMEEAHEEQGAHTWIHPSNGVMIEGEVMTKDNNATPTAEELTKPLPLQEEARMAAERGKDTFAAFCRRLTKSQYTELRPYLESLKPIVEQAESESDQ
jgi:recombination protein RecT